MARVVGRSTDDESRKYSYRVAIASMAQPSNTLISDYKLNLDTMEKLIQSASNDGAQLIVFPETSVNTPANISTDCTWRAVQQAHAEHIPLISNDTKFGAFETPCDSSKWNNRELSQRLSCMAKSYRIYVVVNMGISVPCTRKAIGTLCPPGDVLLFNAMVSFDGKGQLVSRYYKRHTALESPGYVQPTPEILREYPDNPILKTSFGVDFGLLVCFDLAHPYPMDSYKSAGVRNILWANQWPSTPSGTQLSFAQGLARYHKVNIIAAGEASSTYHGVGAFSGSHSINTAAIPSECTNTGLRELNPKCIYYITANLPINPLPSQNDELLKPMPDVSTPRNTFRCGFFSRESLATLSPFFQSQANYDRYMQKLNRDNLCQWIDLKPGESITATIVGYDGSECSVYATLASNEKPAQFLLQLGDVPYISQTPCRTPARSCSFLSAEAFRQNMYFLQGSAFEKIVMQYTSSDKQLSVLVPTIVGDYGSSFDMSSEGTRFATKDDQMQLETEGLVLVAGLTRMLGDSQHQEWPNCNECYSTREGYPIGRDHAAFAIDSSSSLVDQVIYQMNCKDCDTPDGYKSLSDWPPLFTRTYSEDQIESMS